MLGVTEGQRAAATLHGVEQVLHRSRSAGDHIHDGGPGKVDVDVTEVCTVEGVGGDQYPAHGRRHLLLDDDTHVGVVEGDPGLLAKPHTAGGQQGGPDLLDAVDDLFGGGDVVDRLIDAG